MQFQDAAKKGLKFGGKHVLYLGYADLTTFILQMKMRTLRQKKLAKRSSRRPTSHFWTISRPNPKILFSTVSNMTKAVVY